MCVYRRGAQGNPRAGGTRCRDEIQATETEKGWNTVGCLVHESRVRRDGRGGGGGGSQRVEKANNRAGTKN